MVGFGFFQLKLIRQCSLITFFSAGLHLMPSTFIFSHSLYFINRRREEEDDKLYAKNSQKFRKNDISTIYDKPIKPVGPRCIPFLCLSKARRILFGGNISAFTNKATYITRI